MGAIPSLAARASALATPAPAPDRGLTPRRVVLVALLTLAAGWPVLTHPLGLDQGIYAVNAARMLEGEALYKGAWDMKPPGIFFMYAIPVAIGGFEAWPIMAFHLILHFFAALATLRLALMWIGAAGPAWFSLLAYLFYSFGWGFSVTNGQSDDWLLPFFLWGYVHLIEAWRAPLRRGAARALLAGALMGWTLVMRTTMLFAVVLLPLCWLAAGDGARRADEGSRATSARFATLLGAYVAGGLAVGLATLSYFLAAGSFEEMLHSQLEWVRLYAQTIIPWDDFHLLGVFQFFLDEWERNFGDWELYRWAAPIGALGLLSWKGRGRAIPRRGLALWAIGLGLASTSTLVQLKFFNYHFWPTFPFFAMATGLGLWAFVDWSARLWEKGDAATGGARIRWSLAAAAALVLLPLLLYRGPTGLREARKRYKQAIEYMAGNADREDHWNRMKFHHIYDPYADWRVAQAIRARVRAGEEPKMYIWGFKPGIYFMLGTTGPSRFPYNLPLRAPWSPPEWLEGLEAEVMAVPPDFVVVGRADSFSWVVGHHRTSEDDMPAWLRDELAENFKHTMSTKFTHLYTRKTVPFPIPPQAARGSASDDASNP